MQGSAKVNDAVEIPHLKEQRKLKSMQIFKRPVQACSQVFCSFVHCWTVSVHDLEPLCRLCSETRPNLVFGVSTSIYVSLKLDRIQIKWVSEKLPTIVRVLLEQGDHILTFPAQLL